MLWKKQMFLEGKKVGNVVLGVLTIHYYFEANVW
jgi:hypothetical protein